MTLRTTLVFFLTSGCLSVLSVPSIQSADHNVSSAGDSGPNTLRQAVAAALSNPGPDRVIFAPSMAGQTITLATPLDIVDQFTSLEIDGTTSGSTVHISGGNANRVFTIIPGVDLTLKGLRITNGWAANGAAGIDADAPTDGSDGLDGGGIYNFGTLRIEKCTIEGNRAGDGGTGGLNTGAAADAGADGGDGGNGGGIYNEGSLTIVNSTIRNNLAGTGGFGGSSQNATPGFPGNAGDGGAGGGIYSSGGTVTIEKSSILGNVAGAGGVGGISGNNGIGGDGGNGGSAGGMYCNSTNFEISESRLLMNLAGDGSLGGDNQFSQDDFGGSGGSGGLGGAMFIVGVKNSTGNPHISRSVFSYNAAGEGARGGHSAGNVFNGDGTNGGSGGSGGAVTVFNGDVGGEILEIENSTFSHNQAGNGGVGGNGNTAGTGGDGGDAGSGGGFAFAVFGTNFSVDMEYVTVFNNVGGTFGTGGNGGITSTGSAGEGGGIFDNGISVSLTNSVVAMNTADLNPNLDSFSSFGSNFTSGDPLLGAFDLNGSDVESHLPLPGSPLLNTAGGAVGIPNIDQRGRSRNSGNAPDIGAIEVTHLVDLRIGRKSNPSTHRLNDVYNRGGGRPETVKLKGKRKGKVFVSLENDGDHADNLKLKSNRPNRTVEMKVFRLSGGRKNITAALTRRGFTFRNTAAGAVQRTQVQLKSKDKRAGQTLKFTSFSKFAGVKPDAVKAKAKGVK